MEFRKWIVVSWVLAALGNAAALWMIFGYVRTEVTMGLVQKIFYYHVPSAICGYILLGICFVCSIGYLWKMDPFWDVIAYASAEVGLVFITIVLVTGPIWGRAAWGKWWVWEPRLTSALILWLMYAAYFLLRLFSGKDARTARISAVLAIIAFFDVPIVHFAIKWWGNVVHPKHVALESDMSLTFLVSFLGVLLLAAALLLTRVQIGFAEERRMGEES